MLQWITILLLILPFGLFAQETNHCLLYPVSLEQRINQSTLIIEGRVHSSSTFWNDEHTMIYTKYIIKTHGTMKGIPTDTILLITEGGRIGNTMVVVQPSVSLQIGAYGIFLLNGVSVRGGTVSALPFAGPQSMIVLQDDGTARDPFTLYATYQEALERIITITGKPYRFIPDESIQRLSTKTEKPLAASISGISPTVSTAGTESIVTISGSGFGASRTGNAKVEFKNANDGGNTWVAAIASNFVSWADGQIQVRIPSTAGTGSIRVTAVDGTQAVSGQQITITYALLNNTSGGNQYRIWLNNQNLNGGHSFVFNNAFGANPTDAFKRALQTWRCNTFVNVGVEATTTAINQYSYDNVNVVSFNASLPVGALGVTYNWYNNCANDQWYSDEFDMIFAPSPGAGWNFGPEATTGGKYDFETVALHELGHVHQLGHVINSSIVMHYALGTNTDKRTLNAQSDIAGGNDVVSYSTVSKPCGPAIMQALNANTCALFAPPIAQFTASPLMGCAPFQVQFTDLSSNNPTSYAWDIDNNGSTDYTTKNPVHVFTNPGIYSVKLTVSSGSGTSSITMTSYITVNPQPSAQGRAKQTPCYGSTITLGPSNAPIGGLPPYTYSWSPTTDLSNPFMLNPQLSVNFSAQRIYTVTISDQRGCSISLNDTIAPNPAMVISAGADFVACKHSQITLGGQPTAVGGTMPYSYSWAPSIGLHSSTVANPLLTVINSQTFICTVTDAKGCISRDTVYVSMLPVLTVNAGIDTILCTNKTAVLGGSPTVQGGTPPYQYLWTPASGLSSASAANPILLVPQTQQYIVKVTDAMNCTAYDTLQVTAKIATKPQVRFITGSSMLCKGDSAIVEVLGNVSEILWSNGKQTPSITIKETGSYSVSVKTENGCLMQSDTVSISVIESPSMTINGNLKPCAGTIQAYFVPMQAGIQTEWIVQGGTIIGPNNQDSIKVQWASKASTLLLKRWNDRCTTLVTEMLDVRMVAKPIIESSTGNKACVGDTLSLSVTNSYAGYTWSDGSKKNSIVITTSGSYSVIVYDSAQCSMQSDTIEIVFHELPPNPTITFYADSLHSSQAISYQWYNEKGMIEGAKSRSYRPDSSGEYRVRIWDVNECSSISSPFSYIAISNGIEYDELSTIQLIKHPNSSVLRFIHGHKTGEVLQLVNLLGITVYKSYSTATEQSINISELPSGLYILMIGHEKQTIIIGE